MLDNRVPERCAEALQEEALVLEEEEAAVVAVVRYTMQRLYL